MEAQHVLCRRWRTRAAAKKNLTKKKFVSLVLATETNFPSSPVTAHARHLKAFAFALMVELLRIHLTKRVSNKKVQDC